jgi:hypothetical protein
MFHTQTSDQATSSSLSTWLLSPDRGCEAESAFDSQHIVTPVPSSLDHTEIETDPPNSLPVLYAQSDQLIMPTSAKHLANDEDIPLLLDLPESGERSSPGTNAGPCSPPSDDSLTFWTGPASNRLNSIPNHRSISPQRMESWPFENRSIRVRILTTFEGTQTTTENDVAVDQSAQENYKQIESTSKGIFEGYNTLPNGKEVSLCSGYCKLSCSDNCKACGLGQAGDRDRRPEYQSERLEQWEDWADIRTLIKNLLHTHKQLNVSITRNLDITGIPVTPHDPRPFTETVKDWLYAQLSEARMELPYNHTQGYISNESIQKFSSRDNVTAVVQTANEIQEGKRENFRRKAYNSPILFVIFIRHDLPLNLLEDALDNGVSDRSLPLPNETPVWLEPPSRKKHQIQWRDHVVKHQWEFLAATFDKANSHEDRVFSPNMIIPYRSKVKCGEGAFSRVYRIELEHSHQKIYRLPNVRYPPALYFFKVPVVTIHRIQTPPLP